MTRPEIGQVIINTIRQDKQDVYEYFLPFQKKGKKKSLLQNIKLAYGEGS